MRTLCLFLFLLSGGFITGQENEISDQMDPARINLPWLEHLIKSKVDSIRKANGLSGLMNDSICFLAAKDQAEFLKGQKNLTHYQQQNRKKTPQDRVEFYGAKNYLSGENLARIYLFSPTQSLRTKKKKTITINTYGAAADEIVTGWFLSEGHRKNMLSPTYKITAIGLSFNSENESLNAVQVFATVPAWFVNCNPSAIFPYENSFNPAAFGTTPEVKKEIHHQHAYDIRMNPKMKDLQAWKNYEPDLDYSGLAVSNRTIIFNGGKYRAAEKFLKRRRDGMMAEVVPFSRYACNSDEYTNLPGRRNGGCIYNGIALKPIYRKELLNTNFWGKVPKKKPRKLTLALGKVPLGLEEPNEINILLLKRKNIVGMVQFHHLRDTLFFIHAHVPYLKLPPLQPCSCYAPTAPLGKTTIFLFYDVNETRPDEEKIKELNALLARSGQKIERVNIQAFASIEGNLGINDKLYKERARIIHDSLRALLPADCPVTEAVGENWRKFNDQLSQPAFHDLRNLDTMAIRKIMNDSAYTSMKPLLDAQRYSQVTIEYHTLIPDSEAVRYAIKEYLSLYNRLKFSHRNPSGNIGGVSTRDKTSLKNILDYLMESIIKGRAGINLLDTLPLRINNEMGSPGADPLDELYARNILFRFQYQPDLINEPYRQQAYRFLRGFNKADPLYQYNYQAYQVNHFTEKNEAGVNTDIDLQGLSAILPFASEQLDTTSFGQLSLFYHFALACKIASQGVDKFSNATNSLHYIRNYYLKHDCPVAFKVQLARFFLTFQLYDMAGELLQPAILPGNRDRDAYMLWLKIYYARTGIEDLAFSDYQPLFDAARWLTPADFCSLFESDERINFQVLNYEPLRNLYCQLKSKK